MKKVNFETFKRKGNEYIEKDSHYEGITTSGKTFLISKQDYEFCKRYTWVIGKNGYVVTRYANKVRYLHRMLLEPRELHVDHINRNKSDNRRENIRLATREENMSNVGFKKTYSNNSSGCKGVCYNKKSKKWTAYITINKKRKFLGEYKELENAIKARKQAEEGLK